MWENCEANHVVWGFLWIYLVPNGPERKCGKVTISVSSIGKGKQYDVMKKIVTKEALTCTCNIFRT